MNVDTNDTELGRYAHAISIWENEGGAPEPYKMDLATPTETASQS